MTKWNYAKNNTYLPDCLPEVGKMTAFFLGKGWRVCSSLSVPRVLLFFDSDIPFFRPVFPAFRTLPTKLFPNNAVKPYIAPNQFQ